MEKLYYYATLDDLMKTLSPAGISPYPQSLRLDWDLALPYDRLPENTSARILKLVWLTSRDLENPQEALMARATAIGTPEAFLNAMTGISRIAVRPSLERDISWNGYRRICEIEPKLLNSLEERMSELGWGPDHLKGRPGKVPMSDCLYVERWEMGKGWTRTENAMRPSSL